MHQSKLKFHDYIVYFTTKKNCDYNIFVIRYIK